MMENGITLNRIYIVEVLSSGHFSQIARQLSADKLEKPLKYRSPKYFNN